jgi:hypothetical protein
MKLVEAKKLVTCLMAMFPSAKVQQPTGDYGGTLGAYEQMLADLEYAPAMAAIQRIAAVHRFPTILPSIADIREATLTITHGERRPGGDAWGDVLAAVSRFGSYRSPTFDDPVVARCVQQLGWQEICLSENQVADRARFVELYDQLAQTVRRDELTRDLPAVAHQRELRGQARPVAALIGDVLGKGRVH